MLFPIRHNHVNNAGKSLHLFLNFQAQGMRVNAATDVDGHVKPSSQDFGYASCVFDTGW